MKTNTAKLVTRSEYITILRSGTRNDAGFARIRDSLHRPSENAGPREPLCVLKITAARQVLSRGGLEEEKLAIQVVRHHELAIFGEIQMGDSAGILFDHLGFSES